MQHYRLVLKSYWSFSPTSEAFDWGFCFLWGFMSIGNRNAAILSHRYS